MGSLILNVNLKESKKKERLVFEIFEGKIPNLKSQQFSGQLRKVDIDTNDGFDNISSEEILKLRAFLKRNVKIAKNVYLIGNSQIENLEWIYKLGNLFYRDCDRKMYKVLEFSNKYETDLSYTKLETFSYGYFRTRVSICVDEQDERHEPIAVKGALYISVRGKEFYGNIDFKYDDIVVPYGEKSTYIEGKDTYRDYSGERSILCILKEADWCIDKHNSIVYRGKDIYQSIETLVSNGVEVYGEQGDKITPLRMNNVRIDYNMDWFSVDGTVSTQDNIYTIKQILLALDERKRWVSIGHNHFFFTDKEHELLKKLKTKGERVGFDKSDLIDVFTFAAVEDIDINNLEALFNSNVALDVNKSLWNMLREYQREGVSWINNRCQNGFGVCLADDMGLGKTIQIISFLSQESMKSKPNLIVVPKTLLENWKREILRFSPELTVKIFHGTGRDFEDIEHYNVVLTTYGTCLNDIHHIKKVLWQTVILDEAQYVKNSGSKTYKAIQRIDCSMRILLTGTPIENNINEYYNLMRLINPTYLPDWGKLQKMVTTEDELVKLIKKITSPFILRRMKKDVLTELPEKEEQVVYCNFDEKQYMLYRTIVDSIKDYIDSENESHVIKNTSTYVFKGLLRLRQLCCDPRLVPTDLRGNVSIPSSKTDLALSMIGELVNSGHKIVVYSDFPPMLKILEKRLRTLKIPIFYLDGGTTHRQEIVDAFEQSDKGVFLISLKAGGTGLNLVSADTAIIYNPWWNPSSERQAEDRIYRMGQKNKVTIYRLIMADSIEEKMLDLKNKKTEVANRLLDEANGHATFTIEELKMLLS